MRFDTRDKKPALYHLLAEAVVVGIAVFILAWTDVKACAVPIGLLVSLYSLAAIIQLIVAFVQQIRYNPYSYNTIFYFGFALFLVSVFALEVTVTLRIHLEPELYHAGEVVRILSSSAKTYMLFTSPFLLIFSAGLCISNISLIRHEGLKPVNLLGIMLSFLLVGGALFLYTSDYYVSGSEAEVMRHDMIFNFLASVYLYFECMIIGTIVADVITAKHEPLPDKDFIIILGCSLRKDGTPTPLLRGRVDRALAFAKKQKSLTGRDVTFVTSGGQGPDEVCSESASMKRYLIEQGVPADRIIEEDKSTTTLENMRFSKEKILALRPDARVAFSTTNYHVFRSGVFARRVKMRAVGMGAPTKWYFWPNAAVREFAGLVTSHKLKQGLILAGITGFYLILTVLTYHLH